MAEVTREMILEYMQRKGGVVKNVDLVRHFRKFLQVDNSAAKDKARELFKERVNQVAYIKADNQGEKYLYLKAEYSRPPAGPRPSASLSQGDVRRGYLGSRSSVDSFASSPPSSAHSALSQRDSTHSILSARSSGDGDLSHAHSQQQRTPAHPAPSGRDSGHPPPSGRDSGHPPPSGRDSGHPPQSGRDSSPRHRSGQSSYLNGPSPSLSSPSSSSGRLQSSHPPSHSTSAQRRGSAQPSSSPPSHHAISARKSLQSLGTSASIENSFDSLLGKGGGGGEKGGESSSASQLGGDTSFASDIFGSIGGFWSDSAPTTSSTFASSSNQETTTTNTTTSNSASERQPVTANSRSPSEHRRPESSNIRSSSDMQRGSVNSTDSAGLRGGRSLYTQKPQSTSAYSRSQIASGNNPEVSIQSYKPLSSSPPTSTSTFSSPPSTSTFSPYSSLSPSQPLHTPPSKRGTSTSSGDKSDSQFNSTTSKASASDGEALLNQMTSELSSLGDFGSLFTSLGDFSMDKLTTSTFTSIRSTESDQLSKKPSTGPSISSSRRGGGGGGGGGRGRGGTEVRDDGKVPISEPQQQQNSSRGRSTTGTPPATSPRPPHPSSTTHTVPQGSPIRVPRRHLGPPIEPPPPPPSSSPSSSPSTFMRRQGSNDSSHLPGAVDESPRIIVQRIDSGSSNGITSPLIGDGPHSRFSGSSQGLPPLPPSAMTGTSLERRSNGALANGSGLGVVLRQDKSIAARPHSVVRRSRGNLERNTNLDSLTRASIMMTPPSVRRSIPAAGAASVVAKAVVGSREDLNVHSLSTQESGDEGSLAAPSDEYDEIDPLEKEWMLACASANMEEIHTLFMRDQTLVNRRDFLHGYTALHWAAKLGRCDMMSVIIINGSFVDIRSNGGFTPLHLAAQGGYDNAIAMLVRDHGANVNARDNSGRKPIDMLHYNTSEQTRALLSRKLSGMAARTMQKVEYLPSFSQPRNISTMHNSWGSIPSVLNSTEEKAKKKTSPRLNVRKSFSFRNKHKLTVTPKDKESRRPKSHIPSFGESYDV